MTIRRGPARRALFSRHGEETEITMNGLRHGLVSAVILAGTLLTAAA